MQFDFGLFEDCATGMSMPVAQSSGYWWIDATR
jgi:hypothetical protein